MARAHDNGPFKEFDFLAWFTENLNECCSDFSPGKTHVRREKARQHMRNALKEQLLAMRDVLDSVIEEIDKKSPPPAQKA